MPTEVYAAQPQAAFAPGAAYAVPPVGVPVQAAVFPYGGFWIRVVATLIDGVLMIVLAWALGEGVGRAGIGLRGGLLGPDWLGNLMPTLADLIYEVGLTTTAGGTMGKLLLGYHVVDSSGRHIGLGRSLGRYVAKYISYIVLLLGVIWVGIDSYKQGWHDKIASTYVVRKEFVKP